MIHIGYGDSATGCLNEAIKNFGLEGVKAVPARDDFTQGPISKSHTKEGIEERVNYWKRINSKLNHRHETESFYWGSLELLEQIDDDEITLWIGESSHDILATAWLLTFFSSRKINWSAIHLNEGILKDIHNGKPAVNLAMHTPDQLQHLWKGKKELSQDVIEKYKGVWHQASSENGPYRILDDSLIKTVHQDYYDEYILSFVKSDYKEVKHIIGSILKDGRHSISDTTIEWNIRKLIERNKIEFDGDLTSSIAYKIRKI